MPARTMRRGPLRARALSRRLQGRKLGCGNGVRPARFRDAGREQGRGEARGAGIGLDAHHVQDLVLPCTGEWQAVRDLRPLQGRDGRRDEVAHATFVAAALSHMAPAFGHRQAMAASKRLVLSAWTFRIVGNPKGLADGKGSYRCVRIAKIGVSQTVNADETGCGDDLLPAVWLRREVSRARAMVIAKIRPTKLK